jgi:hypothetical protein
VEVTSPCSLSRSNSNKEEDVTSDKDRAWLEKKIQEAREAIKAAERRIRESDVQSQAITEQINDVNQKAEAKILKIRHDAESEVTALQARLDPVLEEKGRCKEDLTKAKSDLEMHLADPRYRPAPTPSTPPAAPIQHMALPAQPDPPRVDDDPAYKKIEAQGKKRGYGTRPALAARALASDPDKWWSIEDLEGWVLGQNSKVSSLLKEISNGENRLFTLLEWTGLAEVIGPLARGTELNTAMITEAPILETIRTKGNRVFFEINQITLKAKVEEFKAYDWHNKGSIKFHFDGISAQARYWLIDGVNRGLSNPFPVFKNRHNHLITHTGKSPLMTTAQQVGELIQRNKEELGYIIAGKSTFPNKDNLNWREFSNRNVRKQVGLPPRR